MEILNGLEDCLPFRAGGGDLEAKPDGKFKVHYGTDRGLGVVMLEGFVWTVYGSGLIVVPDNWHRSDARDSDWVT